MPPHDEFELIAALRDRAPAPGDRVEVVSGDDAAVVRAGGSHAVVSVDTTVDGVHARLELGEPLATARDFGWRALTTALSDLAACGAPAGEAYIALTAPRDTADAVLLAIGDGLGDAARAYGVSIIGGDVSAGPAVSLSATVVGWIDGAPLTRAGACAGDLIGVTGPIGASGGGLALFLGELGDEDVPGAAALRSAYLRPVAHLAAGEALRAAGASAAIDVSDGLLADAGHLARASGVAITIDPAAVPLATGVAEVAAAGGQEPLRFAQAAGEDFVLLTAVPPARRVQAEAAGVVAWIGEVTAGPPGAVSGLQSDGPGGWIHRGG